MVSAVRRCKGRGQEHQSQPSCNTQTGDIRARAERGNLPEQGLNKGTYQSKGYDVSSFPYIYDPAVVLLQHKEQGLLKQRQGNTALSTGPVFRGSLQTLIPGGIKRLLNPRELEECMELLLLVHCYWIAVN